MGQWNGMGITTVPQLNPEYDRLPEITGVSTTPVILFFSAPVTNRKRFLVQLTREVKGPERSAVHFVVKRQTGSH